MRSIIRNTLRAIKLQSILSISILNSIKINNPNHSVEAVTNQGKEDLYSKGEDFGDVTYWQSEKREI